LTDKNQASQPAEIQVTFPEKGSDSYSVDLGLSALRAFAPSFGELDLGLGVEVHRNTLLAKQQNTRSVVLTADGVLGDPAKIAWLPQAALKYKEDKIKSTDSVVPSLTITATNHALALGFVRGTPELGVMWQPSLGVEYEDIAQAPKGEPTGRVGRIFAQVQVSIYPADHALDRKLELVPSFEIWEDFARSGALKAGSAEQHLSTVSLNYFFDHSRHFALGFDLVRGQNPSDNLPNQHFERIALKVSL
jgi:hypothetical protein